MKIVAVLAVLLTAAPAATVVASPAAAQTMPAAEGNAAKAQAMLRSMLDQVAAGDEPTYENVTAEVAAAVSAQGEAGAEIASRGAITGMDYLGAPPGAHLFRVRYATASYDWLVVMNAEGKFSAMYFHPSSGGEPRSS